MREIMEVVWAQCMGHPAPRNEYDVNLYGNAMDLRLARTLCLLNDEISTMVS